MVKEYFLDGLQVLCCDHGSYVAHAGTELVDEVISVLVFAEVCHVLCVFETCEEGSPSR